MSRLLKKEKELKVHSRCEYDDVIRNFGDEKFVEAKIRKALMRGDASRAYSIFKDYEEECNVQYARMWSTCVGVSGISAMGAFLLGFIWFGSKCAEKALNSQQFADRVAEYASSQGFADGNAFLEDVRNNTITKGTHYEYTSPTYEEWGQSIHEIENSVTHDFMGNEAVDFFTSIPSVSVFAISLIPYGYATVKWKMFKRKMRKLGAEIEECFERCEEIEDSSVCACNLQEEKAR